MNDTKTIVKVPVPMDDRGLMPSDMDGLQRLAAMIAASPFAPGSFKDATSIAVAIDYGMSVGLRPLQALQCIAVINGRPCLYGDGMIAVVRGSGLCRWIKEGTEGTGEQAVGFCETLREGEPEPVRRVFTVADARSAGLLDKSGPWKQYRSRMLMLRARGFCLRDVYGDVLKGLISSEEARDIPTEQAIAVQHRIEGDAPLIVDAESVKAIDAEPANDLFVRRLNDATPASASDIDAVLGA
jgi:hypothetical protein